MDEGFFSAIGNFFKGLFVDQSYDEFGRKRTEMNNFIRKQQEDEANYQKMLKRMQKHYKGRGGRIKGDLQGGGGSGPSDGGRRRRR
jgi:hypothetical protein